MLNNDLKNLNDNNDLDFIYKFNNVLADENEDSPYANVLINGKFHDFESFIAEPTIGSSPVYLSINVQSINSKHADLSDLILNLIEKGVNIEIIALQETWNIVNPQLLLIDGFHPVIFKHREGMRGGGVGFYIKNCVSYEIIDDCSPFENKIIESLTLLLQYPNKSKCYVTSIYRSNGTIPNVTQNDQIQRFYIAFNDLLAQLAVKPHVSFLFTDSNINLISDNIPQYANYLNTMFSHGFLLLNTKSSRMVDGSSSLIDHILSNSKNVNFCSGTLISDISDHFITFICNGKNLPAQQQKSITMRIFSAQNLSKFKEALANVNWNQTTSILDTNDAYDAFWLQYQTTFETIFPLTKLKFNKNIHKVNSYMSEGLLISRGTKINLHKQCLANPSPLSINTYKQFRNIYTKTLRAAKILHIKNKLLDCKGNAKETWKILNECTGRTAKNVKIEKIISNGTLTEVPIEIANEFNNFFIKVGQEISDNIPTIDRTPESYLVPPLIDNQFHMQNVTPEYIVKIVKDLASKNSKDIDGVSSKMIKYVINVICLPLAHIFNLSLNSGIFPTKLKRSKVVPIFKNGNRNDCDNYRPISLLCSISKILEKVVAKKLLSHLQINNLLYEHQYGFLPKRSTEQNLIQVTNYITNALNDGMFCIGVFIDLRKAFDVCSHKILLKKLKNLGIKGNDLKWFESYLSNRMQNVDINGTLSDEQCFNISVIQGSVLGTILFLCYINDFHVCTTLFSTLFADDGSCLAKHKNLNDLILYVNVELQKISNWFLANKMAINTSKTKFILFRTKGKNVDDNVCKVFFNNNEIGKPEDLNLIFPIERIHNAGATKNFKLLGILLDEYLSFDSHIAQLCSKISKSLFIINRVKNFLPKDALLSLYFALVHSHLSYCTTIYGSATPTSLSKLFKIQKKAIRIISHSTFRAHTAPIFKLLKILPLDKMILYSKLKFMHLYANNSLPFSFNESWVRNIERNPGLNLRNAQNYFIKPCTYTTIKRLPLFTFPSLWNSENNSKESADTKKYLRSLKDRLLIEIEI